MFHSHLCMQGQLSWGGSTYNGIIKNATKTLRLISQFSKTISSHLFIPSHLTYLPARPASVVVFAYILVIWLLYL
jgi:hypothetical protein